MFFVLLIETDHLVHGIEYDNNLVDILSSLTDSRHSQQFQNKEQQVLSKNEDDSSVSDKKVRI